MLGKNGGGMGKFKEKYKKQKKTPKHWNYKLKEKKGYSNFKHINNSNIKFIWNFLGSIFEITINFIQYIYILVWTKCLMHRCVCIWWYILQIYNYKLHFQNLSIYHISHVFIGTPAAENLVVFATNIDIKILGVPPQGRACLS